MNYKILFFIAVGIFGLIDSVAGQGKIESKDTNYPDGIYSSPRSFQNAVPTSSMTLIRKAINRKMKKKKIFDRCYFEYAVNEQKITNAFVIVFQGEVYFNSGHLGASQSNNLTLGPVGSYCKVLESGKYLFMVGKVEPNTTGGTVGGAAGGFVGALVGSAIDAATRNYKNGPIAFAYNVEEAKILAITSCNELSSLALLEDVEFKYDCMQSSETNPDAVRQLVKVINEKYTE